MNAIMVVIRGLLRERQFIRAPIKIICPRQSQGLMIILLARRSRAKVKSIAHNRSQSTVVIITKEGGKKFYFIFICFRLS